MNLFLQKLNVTSTLFFYYSTKLKNYNGACLLRCKDNMRFSWPLGTKILNKLQHTEIYL